MERNIKLTNIMEVRLLKFHFCYKFYHSFIKLMLRVCRFMLLHIFNVSSWIVTLNSIAVDYYRFMLISEVTKRSERISEGSNQRRAEDD